MNWDAFKTYDHGYRSAFETLNNQLFERYIKRVYGASVIKFRVVNGSGGDGGVEAYAELLSGDVIAIQSKWFRQAIDDSKIVQIKKSILTAKMVRHKIKEYIICIPHDVNSKKIGRGKAPTTNHEENKINMLVDEVHMLHPDLTLTWWFDNELLTQMQHPENEGVHKHWFDKQVISLSSLKDQFTVQKQNNWLKERYIPELHSRGIIYKQYQKMILAKQYRDELSESLTETINKLDHGQQLIADFLATKEYRASIVTELEKITINLQEFIDELLALQEAIVKGIESFKVKPLTEKNIWPVTIELEKITPTHRQKAMMPKLIRCLRDIHTFDLLNYLIDYSTYLREYIKLVRGGAGTGKTHGLADCTQKHLESDLPAVIIQAKDTPCSNWTEILSHALELPGWNKTEILSALESVAISRDVLKAAALTTGKELEEPSSKVLICVDGLEEETGKESQWCSRISETTALLEKYPRMRFLFSARDYFRQNCIDAHNSIWEEIDLPREGDVSVWDVAESYLKAHNIEVSNLAMIKGLDSLLALRLFCEQYAGEKIISSTHIVTATRELLKVKVERINAEYLASLQQKKAVTQQPVSDALLLIAESSYHKVELEHSVLRDTLLKKIGNTFNASEIELMLDFFVRHGILIRISRDEEEAVLSKISHYYRITYQSIIEHILSEKIYLDIKNVSIDVIPDILHESIVQPLDANQKFDPYQIPPNQQIIQSIVNRLFAETGKLIGENGFLTRGFSDQDILIMQLEAIQSAPRECALSYKEFVDKMFFGEPKLQYMVLKYLIVPSSNRADSAFGSEYLHNILMKQPSAFERDKLWSGFDRFEAHVQKVDIFKNNVKSTIDEYDNDTLHLSEYDNFNERPLLYAWALTNIDQAFRDSLRVALTGWAIKRPYEYIKLLDKIFACNDPQVQEDLASVMLGVASHTSDKNHLKLLAEWTLKNVFIDRESNRNVIVRQGFRAVVEKARLVLAVSDEDAKKVRPEALSPIQLIHLEINQITDADGESYPIVHDLAWYVIKNAYDNFLEYPSALGDGFKDNDCPEAKSLLNIYRERFHSPDMFAHDWSVAAAISYIRNVLGLIRTEGNDSTDETHGGKSKIFTYEEKYTWLAVHYLQGYLSDYIPMDTGDEDREWIKDYLKITDVPNPGEEVKTNKKTNRLANQQNSWVIKEDLARTIDLTGDINANIKAWVTEEPVVDFSKWLSYDERDFPQYGIDQKWLALYNHTALEDASKAGFTMLNAIACLIKEDEFNKLKQIVKSKADGRLHFITRLDGLRASPDTETYSNPSDIVWMDWIEEYSDSESLYFTQEESKLFYTITELTQGTVDGEKYYRIPSKMIRKFLGIQSFLQSELVNSTGELLSFIYKISDGPYRDTQELVLVDRVLLEQKLNEQGLKLCWFADFFKQKNPLNKTLDKDFHTQKSRKYLIWQEGGEWKFIKFWDEYFTNIRDNKKIQPGNN